MSDRVDARPEMRCAKCNAPLVSVRDDGCRMRFDPLKKEWQMGSTSLYACGYCEKFYITDAMVFHDVIHHEETVEQVSELIEELRRDMDYYRLKRDILWDKNPLRCAHDPFDSREIISVSEIMQVKKIVEDTNAVESKLDSLQSELDRLNAKWRDLHDSNYKEWRETHDCNKCEVI